jgi:hypothetical protein
MATAIKKLSSGQWHIISGTKSWVTDQDQTAEQTRQYEQEIGRQHQRVDDWKATETGLQSFLDKINAGTLVADPGTTPPMYLVEYPANNFFTVTKPDLEQRIATQQANHSYIETNHIPELEAELAVMYEVLDGVTEMPSDATEWSQAHAGLGSGVEIPKDPEDALSLIFHVQQTGQVRGVRVNFTADHPSPPDQQLHVWVSHQGYLHKVWEGDAAQNSQVQVDTAYFNGMEMSPQWLVMFRNEATASVNVLKACTLTLYY